MVAKLTELAMVSKLGEFDIALKENGFKGWWVRNACQLFWNYFKIRAVEASSPNAVELVRQQRNVAEEAVVNSAKKVNSKDFKETAG